MCNAEVFQGKEHGVIRGVCVGGWFVEADLPL